MVTVQLASALAHLHLHHQVAHCDLKPANILCKHKDVTELGCVKLADFGFCQRFKSHKEAQFTFNCGAPHCPHSTRAPSRSPAASRGRDSLPLTRTLGTHTPTDTGALASR